MTENLMAKLNEEDTALLIKLSQVRDDDSPGETIAYFVNELYEDLVWLNCLFYKQFLREHLHITTTEQLKTIANYNNLSEADQLHNILGEACDFEGVSL